MQLTLTTQPNHQVTNETSAATEPSMRCFVQALTLAERSEALRGGQTIPDDQVDPVVAQKRFEKWHLQPPFHGTDLFRARLSTDGLDEQQLHDVLGESCESLHQRIPKVPGWLERIQSALFEQNDMTEQGEGMASFLNVVRPLIVQGVRKLRGELSALEEVCECVPFQRETVENLLLDDLGERLLKILSPTLVLEMNVASVEGRLSGNEPTDRHAEFVQSLLDRGNAISLLAEYPVAARLAAEEIERWSSVSIEFLGRLCHDWQTIRSEFCPESDPGTLTRIFGGAGDVHRGGRCVVVGEFQSGFRVVYKPRSLSSDVHFQQFQTWLNHRGVTPRLRTLKVVDCGEHGWVEHVQHVGCDSVEEIRRFYERQGAYLAIFYALEANDLHSENVIASGEHPVPIDLETLFQPLVPLQKSDPLWQKYDATVSRSVLRSGLLPQLNWAEGNKEGLDVSGIGGRGGQKSPDPVRLWDGIGTDQMLLKREAMEMPADRNRPLLHGVPVDPFSFAEDIAKGFAAAYELLMNSRDELLSADGPLAVFCRDEIRVVLRDSRTYGILLRESYHPDLLRNALDRDLHLDRLWTRTVWQSALTRAVPAERDDLRQGDIPIFTTKPSSLSLWTSEGREITDFFAHSGWNLVSDRLQDLCQTDLQQQLWLLRGSLSTLAGTHDTVKVIGRPDFDRPNIGRPNTDERKPVETGRLLDEAIKLGELLVAKAIRGGGKAIWTGVAPRKNGWKLSPTGADLYSGLPGIALFLAYLAEETGDCRFQQTAEEATATLMSLLNDGRPPLATIGAFSGWSGLVYTFAHLGSLWQQPHLYDRAAEIVARISPLVDRTPETDVISGTAGCIAGLLSLDACHPSAQLRDVMTRCGDQLLRSASRDCGRSCWFSADTAEKPLTGFSHGAAGIAWALSRLHSAFGESRFRSLALEGIEFERAEFCTEQNNWPDYRASAIHDNSESQCAVSWCHGAPGIGLARLLMFEQLRLPEIREEIRTAVQTTMTLGFGANDSLCHGDLGNLELLLQVSRHFDDAELRTCVYQIAGRIVDNAKVCGWRCGIPVPIQTPGLMTGLAGIGYELLRLAVPERVPSILTLDRPLTP